MDFTDNWLSADQQKQALIPPPIRYGVKRLSDEVRYAAEDTRIQPPVKYHVLDDVAVSNKFNITMADTDNRRMEKGPGYYKDENGLLTVPTQNHNPTPVGSPKKTAVRRYSHSPVKSEFTGDKFYLHQIPRGNDFKDFNSSKFDDELLTFDKFEEWE